MPGFIDRLKGVKNYSSFTVDIGNARNDNRVDINLKTSAGWISFDKIYLKPRGHSLHLGKYNVVDHDSKTVFMLASDLVPELIPTLFHEIGHVYTEQENYHGEQERINENIHNTEDEAELLKLYKEIIQLVEVEERSAWVKALDLIDELIDEGCDILSAFESREELFKFVNKYYNDFENQLTARMGGKMSVESIQQLDDYTRRLFDEGRKQLRLRIDSMATIRA